MILLCKIHIVSIGEGYILIFTDEIEDESHPLLYIKFFIKEILWLLFPSLVVNSVWIFC